MIEESKKQKQVGFRITCTQYQELLQLSEHLGMSVSEYIIYILFGNPKELEMATDNKRDDYNVLLACKADIMLDFLLSKNRAVVTVDDLSKINFPMQLIEGNEGFKTTNFELSKIQENTFRIKKS